MPPPLLATDGYKFSMAEAGYPLRTETFYYAHRKGGAQVVPVDLEKAVRALLPTPTPDDYAYLAANEYEMGAGFKAAILRHDDLHVRALPKGTVFYAREPILTVTGPSALVSWLEPLLLQLNYRIQVATLALTDWDAMAAALSVVTCESQRQVTLEVLDEVGVRAPQMRVDSESYVRAVRTRAAELVEIVGDGTRIFEVGLRAASTLEQHLLALDGCRQAGISRTSNVHGARLLQMVPVGTMGHEHVQRYGSDLSAFRAMRDRRPQRSSYLLDTFDTLESGLPAAFQLISEAPSRSDSIRYDSGDKERQYVEAAKRAHARGLRPVQIIEDGADAAMTRRFEQLRSQVGWKESEQFYGYGGYLVAGTMPGGLTRDRVAAVYKLSQSGPEAVMKFGNELAEGKRSVPGVPVVWRRVSGEGPVGMIAQLGEPVPGGYRLLSGEPLDGRPFQLPPPDFAATVRPSPQTVALADALEWKHFPHRVPSAGGPTSFKEG